MNNIKEVLKQYDFIDFALLFGSCANDTTNFLSDVDVAISTCRDIDIFTRGDIIVALEDVSDKKIDLVVLNDLYKHNPKLAFNIMQNHKIIFCKDKSKYDDFRLESLRYYEDVKYMYSMLDIALEQRLQDGTYGQIRAS